MARRVWTALVPFAVATVVLVGQGGARVTVDRIVAVVNGDIITLSEVQEIAQQELRKGRGRYRARAKAEERANLEQKILEGLIVQKLQVQQAHKLGIKVSDADVDNAAREVQARTGLSEEEFRSAIANQGITYEKYRQQIRNRILQERLINSQVRSKVHVFEEEVQAYYEEHQKEFIQADEVRARVISMRMNSEKTGGQDMTFEAMQQLSLLLLEGEDFVSLAREFSQDEHASAGGDVGWIGRGTLPSQLERVVFTLRPGEVSDILVGESRYYIFKVEEQRGDRLATFEEVGEGILQALVREKGKRQFEEWMEELRRDAIIENRYADLE